MRSPYAVLQEITGIRRQEHKRLFLMMTYLLIVIACYTTTKAVRDSLFVVEVGPAQLPYLYILIAVVMAVISSVYSRAVNRVGLHRVIQWTSLSSVLVLLMFWALAVLALESAYYALYIWVSLFGVITASQVWALAAQVFDAREARRVFGWLGVGGIMGGILGGALTRWVAPRFGTEALLPVCAFLIFWTLIIAHIVGRSEQQREREAEATAAAPDLQGNWAIFNQVLKSRHLSFLVVLLGCGVIVEAFADYTYKVVALRAFSSKDELTAFFGTLSSYGGLLALLVQMVLTSRILKRFGVGPAILLFPSAMLGAFLIIAAQPVLWAVAFLRLVDAGLSYSIHRSGMELLYVPISAQQRNAIKGFIDMFVDRVGRAAGGVILLALTAVFSLSVVRLSLVASAFLVLWIVAAVAVRKQYIQAFRQALEKKTIEPEALDIRVADWGTVETLVKALSSEDPRRVLYALDLLGAVHPRRWKRCWPALVQHPSSAVRARTLAVLASAGEAALTSEIQPLLHDPDVRVQVEAVHYACVTSRNPAARLREFLSSGEPRVVYAAVQCMAEYRLGNPNDIDNDFMTRTCQTQGDDAEYARAAAASALNLNWSGSQFASARLQSLLSDPSPRVVAHAIRTSGDVRFEGAIPVLIERLSESRFRRASREALLKFGEDVIPVLARALTDPDRRMPVKVRIPQVLAHTGRQAAVDVLLAALHTTESDLDYPVIKALSHSRVSVPQLLFDSEKVTRAIGHECRQHRYLRITAHAVHTLREGQTNLSDRARDVMSLLVRALHERMEQRVERVFRLLGLIHPPEDMYATYLSHQAKPELRASAIEFLDNVLDPPLKDWVVLLLDEGDTIMETSEDRGPAAGESSIQHLMTTEDWWLRTIALELARQLKIPEPAGVEIHAAEQ